MADPDEKRFQELKRMRKENAMLKELLEFICAKCIADLGGMKKAYLKWKEKQGRG